MRDQLRCAPVRTCRLPAPRRGHCPKRLAGEEGCDQHAAAGKVDEGVEAEAGALRAECCGQRAERLSEECERAGLTNGARTFIFHKLIPPTPANVGCSKPFLTGNVTNWS